MEENGNHEGTNSSAVEERLASMAVKDAEDNNTVTNAADGEKTQRTQKVTRQSTGDFDYSTLPRSLIATNVDDEVFTDEVTKKAFTDACSYYGAAAVFYYLRGFKRIRVDYETPEQAVRARIGLHQNEICGKPVSFFFLDTSTLFKDGNKTLQPPQPQRQFLLSPPCSPPVGWEPAKEADPIIDYDLLAALANLAPDKKNPVISGIPFNITLPADCGTTYASVSWIEPTASDNYGIHNTLLNFTSSHKPGSTFSIGDTTVTYTAVDLAGNIGSQSFIVTIEDIENPVILGIPADISHTVLECVGSMIVNWSEPTAIDNSGYQTLTTSHTSGTSFLYGITTVSYTATDDAGNTVSQSFTVTISTGIIRCGLPSQSSTGWNGTAPRAIDGNTSAVYRDRSCTATSGVGGNAWWMVDLGSSVCIGKVTITNRQDSCCKHKLTTAVVRIGPDANRNNSVCGPAITLAQIQASLVIDVQCDLKGRYISIHLSTNEILTLCEVQLSPGPCPNETI